MVIKKAAIMFSNGEVVEGYTYSDIAMTAAKLGYGGEKIYGFTTGSDEFVLPFEAAEIAVKSGQVTQLIKDFSPEDLWPTINS